MKNDYYVITDFSEAEMTLGMLFFSKKDFSFDLETTGLDERAGSILGIGFCWAPHTGIYIPLNTREIGLWVSELKPFWSELDQSVIVQWLRRLLTQPGPKKVAHNLSFELKWLKEKWDIEPVDTFCTYFYNFIVYPDTSAGYEERLSLGHIVEEKYPDLHGLKDIWAGIKSHKKDRDLSQYHTTQKIGEYCAGDCDATFREYLSAQKDIVGKPYQLLFPRRLMREVHFVSRMNRTGFPVDLVYLRTKRAELKAEKVQVLDRIQEVAGSKKFDPNKQDCQADLFLRKLKLPPQTSPRKDKLTGKVSSSLSFDDSALSLYANQYGATVALDFLEYRRLSKLISTYFDGIERAIDPRTGRVHADFKPWGTVTGRISCREPNMQNLPVRDPRSRIVKRIFVAAPGYVLVGADYSQIELRLLAYYSQDPMLLRAYLEGIDVHTLTASILYGVPTDKVTKEQRYVGKTSNFALCYGGGAGVLLPDLGNKIMGPEYADRIGVAYDDLPMVMIPDEVLMAKANEFRDKYFQGYVGLNKYLKKTIKEARERGYVVTDYGRVRYLPGINSEESSVRDHWERCAVNSRPQGTASDYQMFHFDDMIEYFDSKGYGVDPLISVHDQCVMHVPEDKVDLVLPLVPELGVRDDESKIGIPMKLEPSSGHDLGEV